MKGNHEISYQFWVNNFKADYAVHFNIVWNELCKFMESHTYYSNFVNESSKWKIQEVLDSDRKHYITSANIN